MKHFAIPLILILLSSPLSFTQTISEFEVLSDGFEVEKVKNDDLELVKEIIRDKNKQIVQFYNYDSKTGKLQGEFNNAIYTGTISNGLITSSNYIYYLNPDYSSSILYISGNIYNGILDGSYDVNLREYDNFIYCHEDLAKLNSEVKGGRTSTYQLFANKSNAKILVDKTVGYMHFNMGKLLRIDFQNKGFQYRVDYDAYGYLDYFVIRDLTTKHTVDSFKVGGKLALLNGSFEKSKYQGVIDSLATIRQTTLSTYPYPNIFNTVQESSDNLKKQLIPEINPFSNVYKLNRRDFANGVNQDNYVWRWSSYVSSDLKSVVMIPLCGGDSKRIGLDEFWAEYNKPAPILSCFKLKTIITSTKMGYSPVETGNQEQRLLTYLIPFFEFEISIDYLVNTYGTIKGYQMYNLLIGKMDEKLLKNFKLATPLNSDEIIIRNKEDLSSYPNK